MVTAKKIEEKQGWIGLIHRACSFLRKKEAYRAFTLIELAVMIVTVVLLVGILVPGLVRQRQTARVIQCSENLKWIGVAFKTWSTDSTDNYPMAVPSERGGTLEATTTGEVFLHFQSMSNELTTPKRLICPADNRLPSTSFSAGFSNTNVSYFVGVSAKEEIPEMLLSGDRNLTNTATSSNRVLEVTANSGVGWNHELHRFNGNVLICDGSVMQLSSSRLQTMLCVPGITNRLAIP